VDRIAWDVGYSDPTEFRKIFQILTGVPPAIYLQRFGIAVK
jgi:transcriptional regulator GlxA family with amidase domain